MPYHNDTIIMTQEEFFNKYVPLTLLQGFEKVIQGFMELETEQNCNILTPTLSE